MEAMKARRSQKQLRRQTRRIQMTSSLDDPAGSTSEERVPAVQTKACKRQYQYFFSFPFSFSLLQSDTLHMLKTRTSYLVQYLTYETTFLSYDVVPKPKTITFQPEDHEKLA